MDALPNAVLLSRPLHAEELVRSVRSALKARARQYEARDRMQELQMREAQLHESKDLGTLGAQPDKRRAV